MCTNVIQIIFSNDTNLLRTVLVDGNKLSRWLAWRKYITVADAFDYVYVITNKNISDKIKRKAWIELRRLSDKGKMDVYRYIIIWGDSPYNYLAWKVFLRNWIGKMNFTSSRTFYDEVKLQNRNSVLLLTEIKKEILKRFPYCKIES